MSSTKTSLVPTPARNAVASPISQLSNSLSTPMKTAPSTPASKQTQPPVRPSPGTFKHPRLAEIIQRQQKNTLTQSNFKSAVINTTALILSFALRNILTTIITTLLTLVVPSATATSTTSFLFATLRLLFVLNITLSLRPKLPYLSHPDPIDDIPLTPSQRSLLGLPPSRSTTNTPSNSPLAPSTGYITPPRYHRRLSSSSTPPDNPPQPSTTDLRSISANYSASPLSTSRAALGFSPTSPSAPQTQPQPYTRSSNNATNRNSPSGSPLFYKALERQRRQSQDFELGGARSSFGVGSPSSGLGRSRSVRDQQVGEGGQQSPAVRARKGVNFKWLYDMEYSLKGPGQGGGAGGGGRGRGLAASQSMNF